MGGLLAGLWGIAASRWLGGCCLAGISCLWAAETVIVVTAFQPFAGRGVNGSETVSRALMENQEALLPEDSALGSYRLVRHSMPVRWGITEQQIPNLVMRHEPQVLIGLGEGHPGRIAIEGRAHNLAQGLDEDGNEPPAHLGNMVELWRPARWQITSDTITSGGVPIIRSDDAGTYLCNAWLWQASATAVPVVGFIHLPPQGEMNDDEYLKLVLGPVQEIIAQAINP